MGACACKKNAQASIYKPTPYYYNPAPTPHHPTTPHYAPPPSQVSATTKKETTIQPSAIKEALAKLQHLLQGHELDKYVKKIAKYYKNKIPFKEYQRIMNGFESGIVPAISATSVQKRPEELEELYGPAEEGPAELHALTDGNKNLLLQALKQVAGGWKDEQPVMAVDFETKITEITKTTETKEEEPEEPAVYCFQDSYTRQLSSCPDGCTLEAVEGLAKQSTFKNDPAAKDKVSKAFLKTLRKELRSLKKSLLLTPDNSMFVRYDEDQPQFMRAVITGNSDSPYAHGAFLFDIFLPPTYPAVPPKIVHITPGATSVHANNGPGGFSPNMHQATGKICLSLLGTWAGPGWESGKSNLYQVLSTICFAILSVDHPYYMEPNYGGWEGTAPTSNHQPKVIQYTEEVERGCVKFAMMGPLTKPYKFFEEVLFAHFAAKRLRIAQTIDRWTNATNNPNHRKQLVAERKGLFDALAKATQTAAQWDESSRPFSTK